MVQETYSSFFFIDDAGLDHSLLAALVRFRKTTGSDFTIIATCWPGEASQIRRLLHIPESHLVSLPLLSRKQIVEIIREVGLQGPERLLREIVDQARGCPGLAATLADLCLKDGVRHVALGDALYDDLYSPLAKQVGEDGLITLATFALAGESGISVPEVAAHLEKREAEIHHETKKMAAAGVLVELAANRLKVVPQQFQYVLAREEYFGGAHSLRLGRLTSQVNPPSSLLFVAIQAKARGGKIDDGSLQAMLEEFGDNNCWESYAGLGENEARWILEKHEERLMDVVYPCLEHIPTALIPLLLDKCPGDDRALNSATNHPMRILQDWVKSGSTRSGKDFEHRSALQRALLNWSEQNLIHDKIILTAIETILSPAFEYSEGSADRGAVILSRGLVSFETIGRIPELWDEVYTLLQRVNITSWNPLFEIFQVWRHPRIHGDIPEDYRQLMDAFGQTILSDIAKLSVGHAGVARRILEISLWYEGSPHVEVDSEFNLIFPIENYTDNYETEQNLRLAGANQLGDSWATEEPEEVLEKIENFERWASEAGIGHPNLVGAVCARLAENSDTPEIWVEGVLTRGLGPNAFTPFFARAIQLGGETMEVLIRKCLDDELFRGSTVLVLIHSDHITDDLWQILLGHFGQYPLVVEHAKYGALSHEQIKSLLEHPNDAVSAAAVVGLWNGNPDHEFPDELKPIWEAAILTLPEKILGAHNDHTSYWMREIFKKEPELGFNWLSQHMNESGSYLGERELEFISDLSDDHKSRLITMLPTDQYIQEELVSLLVGEEPRLYRELLKHGAEKYHFMPLHEKPEGHWIDFAMLALEHGYTTEQVSRAVFSGSRTWRGKESAMWRGYKEKFEILKSHDNHRLRDLGEEGRRFAIELVRKADDRENRSMYS